MEVSLPIQTTFFWEITLIEEGRAFKPSVYCMHTRLSIQRKSTFLEEITSRHPLPGYMVFTKNVIVFLFLGKSRYNMKLWKSFVDCFNCMPVAALIEDKILCMHGGLSPELTSVNQINEIVRPTDIPDTGLLCDLLWADPEASVKMWG
jgi:hypothetical protein